MERGKAKLLLHVDHLQTSVSFYTSQLGWELVEAAVTSYTALLRIGMKDEIVLIQRGGLMGQEYPCLTQIQEPCLTRWLQPKHACPQVGDLIYIGVASVNEMEAILQQNGRGDLRKEEETGHIRKLFVPTIDGYTLVYWQELSASNEEIVAMYAAGPNDLECALDSLSDEQLNLKETPNKWSIREHVLHFIDLELVTIHKVKFALAEPGRAYQGNPFSQDDWCTGLLYGIRPITCEVQMFRAIRQHILGLCEHLPDALERKIITNDREESVAKLMKMMAGHASHHIRAVEKIRERNGC